MVSLHASALLPLTGVSPLAPAPGWAHPNPIYPGDFPDPFVLPVSSGYYAYATNTRGANMPTLKLSADFSQAQFLGDALPRLPRWAAAHRSLTWAPAVLPRAGQYVLYYTARCTRLGQQSISRAVSPNPAGPFRDDSTGPLVCQTGLGGSIDPSPFVDPDGRAYLLWKNDGNSCGKPAALWIQPLSEDGLSLVGEACPLLHMDQAWERPLIEAPAMLYQDGQYYLFYSGNWWESDRYAIGYAVGVSPTGPFVKPAQKPWFGSRDGACGPGGAEFFRDSAGQVWMAYHAWTAPHIGYPRGKRSLHIAPVSFQEEGPGVPGVIRT